RSPPRCSSATRPWHATCPTSSLRSTSRRARQQRPSRSSAGLWSARSERSSAGRKCGDRGAGNLHFAGLVREGDVEVDEALAVLLALARDSDLRRQRLTGPRLL